MAKNQSNNIHYSSGEAGRFQELGLKLVITGDCTVADEANLGFNIFSLREEEAQLELVWRGRKNLLKTENKQTTSKPINHTLLSRLGWSCPVPTKLNQNPPC